MTVEQKIESLLFAKGEPMKVNTLAKIINVSKKEIESACDNLSDEMRERGIVLIQNLDEVALATNPNLGSFISDIIKEELQGPLSKNSLETLSIILYHGPLSKPQIDCIRGVNSNFILRNLAIRGLIERKKDPKDSRTHVYNVSLDLISFLGITKPEELPGYTEYKNHIERALLEAENMDNEQTNE